MPNYSDELYKILELDPTKATEEQIAEKAYKMRETLQRDLNISQEGIKKDQYHRKLQIINTFFKEAVYEAKKEMAEKSQEAAAATAILVPMPAKVLPAEGWLKDAREEEVREQAAEATIAYIPAAKVVEPFKDIDEAELLRHAGMKEMLSDIKDAALEVSDDLKEGVSIKFGKVADKLFMMVEGSPKAVEHFVSKMGEYGHKLVMGDTKSEVNPEQPSSSIKSPFAIPTLSTPKPKGMDH